MVMKSILISIKPKYCELIANNKKVVEVRKTKPKIPTPFKCFIYCTKPKEIFSIGGGLYDYKDQLYRLPTGEIKFGDGFELMCDYRDQYDENNFLNGKVIGEFICMGIMQPIDNYKLLSKLSCVPLKELYEYSKCDQLYGWRIHNLLIYDKPKELVEFYKPCPHLKRCETCKNSINQELPFGEISIGCDRQVKIAPQSWCYVYKEGTYYEE